MLIEVTNGYLPKEVCGISDRAAVTICQAVNNVLPLLRLPERLQYGVSGLPDGGVLPRETIALWEIHCLELILGLYRVEYMNIVNLGLVQNSFIGKSWQTTNFCVVLLRCRISEVVRAVFSSIQSSHQPEAAGWPGSSCKLRGYQFQHAMRGRWSEALNMS